MKRSLERILCTHVGSLPRPQAIQALIQQGSADAPNRATFRNAVRRAVRDVVAVQVQAGLDVVNDGEQSKPSFSAYVPDRLTGFDGPPGMMPLAQEAGEFPEWWGQHFGNRQLRASCGGPIEWRDFGAVEADIQSLRDAGADFPVTELFLTSASPGTIANFFPNRYFPSRERYLAAIAEAMKLEYEAIASAGIVLQIDCPDLALRHFWFPDLSIQDFRREIALNLEALNHATAGIPPESMRIHVCWGAGEQPHNHDVELEDIVDIILTARPAGVSIVGANGRHEHEWHVWERHRLPDGKVLIPGVIDNTTNIIEHPAWVAERIIRYADMVGRENLIAGVDCGFATSAASRPVDPKIVVAKLAALRQGADLATRHLWGT
jgi:5-methyltetrahydropteroyltriglutamate--homocysteine methyltransferase